MGGTKRWVLVICFSSCFYLFPCIQILLLMNVSLLCPQSNGIYTPSDFFFVQFEVMFCLFLCFWTLLNLAFLPQALSGFFLLCISSYFHTYFLFLVIWIIFFSCTAASFSFVLWCSMILPPSFVHYSFDFHQLAYITRLWSYKTRPSQPSYNTEGYLTSPFIQRLGANTN